MLEYFWPCRETGRAVTRELHNYGHHSVGYRTNGFSGCSVVVCYFWVRQVTCRQRFGFPLPKYVYFLFTTWTPSHPSLGSY